MKHNSTFPLIAMLALLVAAPAAWAQQSAPGAIEARLAASKVVRQAGGKEVTASADTAKPGDVLEYRVTYVNRSRETVRNLAGTLPIPPGMEYLPRTAQPGKVLGSLDGVKYEALPLMRKVKRPDGSLAEEPVPYQEYRSLRWLLGELAPGKTVTVSARVQLTPIEPAAAVQADAAGTSSKP